MNRYTGNLLMVDDSKQNFEKKSGMSQEMENLIISRLGGTPEQFCSDKQRQKEQLGNKRSSEGRPFALKKAEEVISIQIGDIAARRAKDDAVAKKNQTNKQKHLLFVVTQIKAVTQDNPEMMQQSSISHLSQNESSCRSRRKRFSTKNKQFGFQQSILWGGQILLQLFDCVQLDKNDGGVFLLLAGAAANSEL